MTIAVGVIVVALMECVIASIGLKFFHMYERYVAQLLTSQHRSRAYNFPDLHGFHNSSFFSSWLAPRDPISTLRSSHQSPEARSPRRDCPSSHFSSTFPTRGQPRPRTSTSTIRQALRGGKSSC